MKPAKLTCPYAHYDERMYIRCDKNSDMCAHQRWCNGKGWCVLTDQAGACPARVETDRKDGNNERKVKTAPKRRNKV